jgi:hypothetical protein
MEECQELLSIVIEAAVTEDGFERAFQRCETHCLRTFCSLILKQVESPVSYLIKSPSQNFTENLQNFRLSFLFLAKLPAIIDT